MVCLRVQVIYQMIINVQFMQNSVLMVIGTMIGLIIVSNLKQKMNFRLLWMSG